MTPSPPWLADIENRAGTRLVLLVEGDDDAVILAHFLDHHGPAANWGRRFTILTANKKDHVRTGCKQHPSWIGVVDSDEWNPTDLQRALQEVPRLRALPRFCLESYFCHPAELWAAIPEQQRNRFVNDQAVLANPIYAALPGWLAHGAMWRVLREMYRATNFPAELENDPITDETRVRQILETWHRDLAPDVVLNRYRAELAVARQRTRDEQLCYIHGKKFFRQTVVPTLNGLFGQRSADTWLQIFRNEHINPPQDLQDLLDEILSLVP